MRSTLRGEDEKSVPFSCGHGHDRATPATDVTESPDSCLGRCPGLANARRSARPGRLQLGGAGTRGSGVAHGDSVAAPVNGAVGRGVEPVYDEADPVGEPEDPLTTNDPTNRARP